MQYHCVMVGQGALESMVTCRRWIGTQQQQRGAVLARAVAGRVSPVSVNTSPVSRRARSPRRVAAAVAHSSSSAAAMLARAACAAPLALAHCWIHLRKKNSYWYCFMVKLKIKVVRPYKFLRSMSIWSGSKSNRPIIRHWSQSSLHSVSSSISYQVNTLKFYRTYT